MNLSDCIMSKINFYHFILFYHEYFLITAAKNILRKVKLHIFLHCQYFHIALHKLLLLTQIIHNTLWYMSMCSSFAVSYNLVLLQDKCLLRTVSGLVMISLIQIVTCCRTIMCSVFKLFQMFIYTILKIYQSQKMNHFFWDSWDHISNCQNPIVSLPATDFSSIFRLHSHENPNGRKACIVAWTSSKSLLPLASCKKLQLANRYCQELRSLQCRDANHSSERQLSQCSLDLHHPCGIHTATWLINK